MSAWRGNRKTFAHLKAFQLLTRFRTFRRRFQSETICATCAPSKISAPGLRSFELQRRTRHVHRRTFLRLFSATVVWPCVAAAESAKKRPVIGILAQGTPAQLKGLRFRQSFLDGMRELGYIEGRDFDTVTRAAESTGDLPRVAKDLVQLNPDVILAAPSAM